MSAPDLSADGIAALHARVRKLGTATLFEASALPCAVDPQVRTLWPGAFVAAPAYPVACSPGDNLAIHIALERAPRGSVLVVDTGGFLAGYWGEVLTVAAQAAGLAGLVINGGVRDVAAIRARQFPVFTCGVSVRGTVKASAPSVGIALHFSGVPVAPGDFVVGDDDGVVILPAARVAQIAANGEARADKEADMMRRLAEGATTLELMKLEHWRTAS
ncbi:RraA family protein [Burkholderia lata]|uniref:Diguanylate cyclase n=1 Tax=Burkholderia lata (strain ATCC 17760 / DSM 23089 / LMG 22485 / NCIMB 9086 / R18194 / 383) TaxID=482957 RepID=A0A6P2TE41_BURL3|nr:dimethylmenaquinone methyltransferase [Burkholderia lata]VWC61995.1 diguanylate cyclase [Burkholderia lata]